jgi:hypothetical protein
VGVVLAVAGLSALLCFKKRNSDSGIDRNTDTWIWRDQTKPGELSSNPLHEYPQLDATESAVELPAGYGFHQTIWRPI